MEYPPHLLKEKNIPQYPKNILGNAGLRVKSWVLGITFKERHELTTASIFGSFFLHISPHIPESNQDTGQAVLQVIYVLEDFFSKEFSNFSSQHF